MKRRIQWVLGIAGLVGGGLLGGVVSVAAMSINVSDMVVVAAADVQPAQQGAGDLPMGQELGEPSMLPEDDGLGEEGLFGGQGGYFHPYLLVGLEYTDNLYNLNEGETSNFLTRLSPGIWFSLPRTREIPVTINPHNTSPGGLRLQLKDYEGTDRYQAYALAGIDYKMFSEDSDLNDTDARLEGLFRYNMRGGLSLQVLDRYSYFQDRFEVGAATRDNLRRYNSNIFMATADYRMTEKLRAKVDFSNFFLDYKDEINAFLDRSDNSVDLYGYYDYSLKTSVFLNYRYTDVAYDTAIEKDNEQHFFYGGMTWRTTEKLSLMVKAGYQFREYSDEAVSERYDWDGLSFDAQALYRWTEKTEFTLNGYRRSEESDSTVAIDKVVLGLMFGYKQKYTDKLSGSVDLLYEGADYTQTGATVRDDDRYYVRPALQYLFREWLMAELAYQYDYRDSTQDLFNYTNNTVLFNLNLAM